MFLQDRLGIPGSGGMWNGRKDIHFAGRVRSLQPDWEKYDGENYCQAVLIWAAVGFPVGRHGVWITSHVVTAKYGKLDQTRPEDRLPPLRRRQTAHNHTRITIGQRYFRVTHSGQASLRHDAKVAEIGRCNREVTLDGRKTACSTCYRNSIAREPKIIGESRYQDRMRVINLENVESPACMAQMRTLRWIGLC